jgi:hypothetical protein
MRTEAQCTAAELYKGRSISDAAATAKVLGGSLYIVSAGVGLIRSEERVPNYDLSVVPGSSLALTLEKRGVHSRIWWSAIAGRCTLSELAQGTTTTLVALPSTYVQMVHDDLACVSNSARTRVRIFTSVAGQRETPPSLAACVMPYDDRLETVPGFEGTRADFPQRALRHFVEVLGGHKLSLKKGREAVLGSLAHRRIRIIPKRRRATDDELRRLMRSKWKECGGSSTRLLRYLRDDAKVSCEQGRFRALWLTLVAHANR